MIQKLLKTAIIGTLFLSNISWASVQGETTSYTYKIATGDIGDIETQGADKPAAFKLAADECFNRRVSIYEKTRGHLPDDVALEIIDSCANLPW